MKQSDAPASRDAALAAIRTALIEKKMTQFELADAADCHEKTIQNLLAGRSVRDQTLFDVCMVLGLDFDQMQIDWTGSGAGPAVPAAGDTGHDIAPIYRGGYSREAVDHYVGSYLTLRPAFDGCGCLVAFRTDIFWSDLASSLCFREHNRPDDAYSHSGYLYIPPSSSFIHLVSLTKGAMRMVLISQIDQFGKMRGIITTLNKAVGSAFIPVATPIVYERRESFADVAFGDIDPGQGAFERYKVVLDETVRGSYARLVGG